MAGALWGKTKTIPSSRELASYRGPIGIVDRMLAGCARCPDVRTLFADRRVMTLPKLPELLIIRRFDESRDSHPWTGRLSFNAPPLSGPPGSSACVGRLDGSSFVYRPWVGSRISSCIEVVATSCTGCGVRSALGESAAHCDRLSAEACVRELIQCRACSLAGARSSG